MSDALLSARASASTAVLAAPRKAGPCGAGAFRWAKLGRFLGVVAASFASLSALGCGASEHAEPGAPTALIVAFAPNTPQAVCKPVTAPLDGHIGEPVYVTAACSTDPAAGKLDYAWSLVETPPGAQPTLLNTNAAVPTFLPNDGGTYELRLVVSNGTVASAPALATVVVDPCGGHAPSATALSSDPAAYLGESITLSANVTDADTLDDCNAHAADFTYAWSLDVVPDGSDASLDDSSSSAPAFVTDVEGEYVATLVVTDPTGRASEPSAVAVEAAACGNDPPVIAATESAPARPSVGDEVTLGAGVVDTDTLPECAAHAAVFTYAWSFGELPARSVAKLDDPHIADPSFVPDQKGHYRLLLRVTDPTGRTASSSLVVDVR
jgi:chitodextrinase